ncbi:MAG TPA: B12-binding domain-containing protein, partial [bacterium]|nr:B12-binding domain-containing protein [bacterium]
GLSGDDLLFDPLTFTLASGDSGLKDAALHTLEALRLIKAGIPGARTILGVSNISFGLPAYGRRMLTSVFLHRALEAGLDAAIINPSKIIPLDSVPKEAAKLCARLIDGSESEGDPLKDLIIHLNKRSGGEKPSMSIGDSPSPEEELRLRIIEGSKDSLERIIANLLPGTGAAEILNGILLPAMQEVGRRFGEGRLPLPFVLHSAEAMRAAVDILSPHLKAKDVGHRGTIVLATVRGDVHDIGKNLVDAILSNNGFKVVNIGIRQPAAAIAKAAKEHGADAIGLSGLLVSSTEVMREDLGIFREGGIDVPVLCGGAALTPDFVKDVLSNAYGGRVFYCADAFDGLRAMEEIARKGSGNGERGKGGGRSGKKQ